MLVKRICVCISVIEKLTGKGEESVKVNEEETKRKEVLEYLREVLYGSQHRGS